MAGFFGLFNYEKEGPGISKNAPKKKTFIVFFETFFRNFWKFIVINLVFHQLIIKIKLYLKKKYFNRLKKKILKCFLKK